MTRIHLHPDFSRKIETLTYQTNSTILNSSMKVMHLLENQENDRNILQDSRDRESLNIGGRDWLAL